MKYSLKLLNVNGQLLSLKRNDIIKENKINKNEIRMKIKVNQSEFNKDKYFLRNELSKKK